MPKRSVHISRTQKSTLYVLSASTTECLGSEVLTTTLEYEETEEEEPRKAKQQDIPGNDHYARFYRYLTGRYYEFRHLDPQRYATMLEDIVEAVGSDAVSDVVNALVNYIEDEVYAKLPEAVRKAVRITHSTWTDEYRYSETYIKVIIEWPIAGKKRELTVYSETLLYGTTVATSRDEFNKTIDEIINGIVTESQNVINELSKLNNPQP